MKEAIQPNEGFIYKVAGFMRQNGPLVYGSMATAEAAAAGFLLGLGHVPEAGVALMATWGTSMATLISILNKEIDKINKQIGNRNNSRSLVEIPK